MSKKKKPQDPETSNTTDSFGIVETKLTRTEVIDLVIQESIDRLNKRNDQIAEEMKELLQIDIPLRSLVPAKSVVFSPRQGYTRVGEVEENRFEVSFSVEVSTDRRLQDTYDAWKVLKDEQNKNYQALNALNDRARARMAILKQALENTDDGRQLLEAVKAVSMSVGRRLLLAADGTK